MKAQGPRPVHVYLDGEPPVELIEAAARGECLLVTGKRPDPVKLANVLVKVIDAQLDREDTERAAEAMREDTKKAALVGKTQGG